MTLVVVIYLCLCCLTGKQPTQVENILKSVFYKKILLNRLTHKIPIFYLIEINEINRVENVNFVY